MEHEERQRHVVTRSKAAGCDIHIVLEKKHGDRWVGVQKMGYLPEKAVASVTATKRPGYFRFKLKERDYDFFTALASVRSYNTPDVPEPKGMPDDASDLSRMEIGEDDDLHSHSYTTLRELIPIIAKVKYECPLAEVLEDATANQVAAKLEGSLSPRQVLEEWIDNSIVWNEIDNYRIVYAFDN